MFKICKLRKSKKSLKSQRSHQPYSSFFNTESDIEYEEKEMAEIFDYENIEANSNEIESPKQQHIEIEFQTSQEFWTVSGFLLWTDHVNKLAKLALVLLNNKEILNNYVLNIQYITSITHLPGPK